MNVALQIYSASANVWPVADSQPALKEHVRRACGKVFRRTNHYIELALIGANRCAANATQSVPTHCGVIIATGQGNIAEGAELLNQIFIHKQVPMPVNFINVSNNMAGYYTALSLKLNSSNITVSRLDFPFEAAMELAWLEIKLNHLQGSLVGGIDQCAFPLDQHRIRLSLPANTLLSEGSSWLYVGSGPDQAIAQCHLLEYFQNQTAMLRSLTQFNIDAQSCLSTGFGITKDELTTLGATLNLPNRYEYLTHCRYHDTHAAYGIVSFIEKHKGKHLLHINRGKKGRYCAVYITPPGVAAISTLPLRSYT